MEVTTQFPQWFIYLISIGFFIVTSVFLKMIWARYIMLEAEVDALRDKIGLCATHVDIQSLTRQIREEYLATHKRLDDIHTLIITIKNKQ